MPADSGRPPGTSPLSKDDLGPTALTEPSEALAAARRESEAATKDATTAGTLTGRPRDPRTEAGQEEGSPPEPPARTARPADTGDSPTPPPYTAPPPAPSS